jgi:very-short-patch-repair endonuclease
MAMRRREWRFSDETLTKATPLQVRRKERERQKKESAEATLMWHFNVNGIKFEREYKFALPRKWRFDFAIPALKIAIEVEGGTKFGLSRHSRGLGYENDCFKYNQAGKDGWLLLRYTSDMVKTGIAINDILSVLEMKK